MELLSPQKWTEYELIDSGGFEKLEKFGRFTLRRPEPQALWEKGLELKKWEKADFTFVPEGSSTGKWIKKDLNAPDQWHINYRSGEMKLRFRLALTAFKHVGIFPEQSCNWEFIYHSCKKMKSPRVLNLFAYTGGASLAARAGGADVIHLDSIKQVVNWANTNMVESKLTDIRWIIEDAFKFVKREARRGRIYEGVILDPPAWGHGPKGERWKLEAQINELVQQVSEILNPSACFMVFNAYSLGFSSLLLRNLVLTHFNNIVAKKATHGELYLPDQNQRFLPTGVFTRFFLPDGFKELSV